jgi:hypothetical protein
MSGGDPIGRLFNIVHTADAVYVSLKYAGAVTFVGQLDAGDTFTITEATAQAGTGAQALAKITSTNTVAKAGGTWTTTAQAAGSTVATAATEAITITIRAEQLSDGYSWIKCASTSTGTVMAILHDLSVQRKPANLATVIV